MQPKLKMLQMPVAPAVKYFQCFFFFLINWHIFIIHCYSQRLNVNNAEICLVQQHEWDTSCINLSQAVSLNSILFVFEIWKIWILCLGGEKVSCWDFPGQLSQLKCYLFFVIAWLKHQCKYFCVVCSARTRSRYECVTLGVNNHYQLKPLKVCVFFFCFHGYSRLIFFTFFFSHGAWLTFSR